MLEHKLLYKFQSGFVSVHSTSHQLIELYHKICIALENGHITVATGTPQKKTEVNLRIE